MHLATDERALKFATDFPPQRIHTIKSATIGGRNPLKLMKTVFDLATGYFQAKKLMKKLNPACVIGFGGYPSLPPIMSASTSHYPILVHEQNAVMGRANRFLAKRALAVVMGFAHKGVANLSNNNELNKGNKFKTLVLGNPVRTQVLAVANSPYEMRDINGPFNLLVFGGSQGAQYFSQILPKAIALLDRNLISKLHLVQQARSEDEKQLCTQLSDLGIKFEVAQFFPDMAERIKNADFVISRAGASTVSELTVIGRPSILVPYPFALDHDQAMNAAQLELNGGCMVIAQAQLSASRLAEAITNAINRPKHLEEMAKSAKKSGRPEAVIQLANLVEHVIDGKLIEDFR